MGFVSVETTHIVWYHSFFFSLVGFAPFRPNARMLERGCVCVCVCVCRKEGNSQPTIHPPTTLVFRGKKERVVRSGSE